VALVGAGKYFKVEISHLSTWARVVSFLIGGTVFALAFIVPVNSTKASSANPVTMSPSPSHLSASPTASPVQSTPLARSVGTASATLKTPTKGTKVSRSKGFTATGTASSLGSDTVWILDYDGGYTVDQEAKVNGGQWSAADYPLGDPSDHLPFPLTMKAVLANPHCATRLNKLSSSKNDY